MSGFRDAQGNTQQVDLTVGMYREASLAGQTLAGYLATQFPTNSERFGSTFEQICASEGIFIRGNRELGIRATTLDKMIGPQAGMQAGVTVKDAVPASRILFPAVALQAVEDRLQANLAMTPNAFESMIAIDESINGDRYEQPQINFDRPAAARSQIISQLSKPAAMLTITASDVARTIPTYSLGLEISDQALRASTLDLVTLSLTRQIEVERNERAQQYILAMLNGDADNGEASLASLGKSATTTSYDSTATGGVITQKAWTKFLSHLATTRTITTIVTDIDGALAVENRTGRPNVQTDDPKSTRINTLMDVINPLWPAKVRFFINLDSAWPAATLMGFDQRYALRRVRNLFADYTAIESFVLRRAQAMRFDHGEHVTRLYNDAFDVLTIA